jgi:hypothetical protein
MASNDENRNNEVEVIEIELDEYNKMREELKSLREAKQPKEVVKISREDYDALKSTIESYKKAEEEAPKFGAYNQTFDGYYHPSNQMMRPVNKPESFGKTLAKGVGLAAGTTLATVGTLGIIKGVKALLFRNSDL